MVHFQHTRIGVSDFLMRLLILSCSTGHGHDACAKAIQELCQQQAQICDSAEALTFISPKFSKFVSWGHTTIYRKIPSLMKNGYAFTENHPDAISDGSAIAKLMSGGVDRLYKFLLKGQYDTVISTHPFASTMLTIVQKQHHLPIRIGAISTDYTCLPSFQNADLDVMFIASEKLTDEFVGKNIPASKLVASGIPIGQKFFQRTDMRIAKQQFDIPQDAQHLVMMCGSMGCGPMEKMLSMLSIPGTFHITVICGTNEALAEKLTKEYAHMPFVHIRGFERNIPLLLDSADIFLTKPGGLSSTEGAVKTVPMVYVDTVAACESYNMDFFVNAGGAVAAKKAEDVVLKCFELLEQPERLVKMRQALENLQIPNGAQCIVQTMQTMLDEKMNP